MSSDVSVTVSSEPMAPEQARPGKGRHVRVGKDRASVLVDFVSLALGIALVHLVIGGTVPSGGDGGNWLALARELLGESVMSADVIYEPVFPGLVAILSTALPPIVAIVLASFIAELALAGLVYYFLRSVGRAPAKGAAVLVIVIGYRLEAYAWGAYPQILAMSLGLAAVWLFARFVARGDYRILASAGLVTLAVLGTHKLVGGLLIFAVPVAVLYIVWIQRWERSALGRGLLVVAVSCGLGALFAASWLVQASRGVEPTINTFGLSLTEQLQIVVREAPVPWLLLLLLAFIGVARRAWPPSYAPLIAGCIGWFAASVALFLALGEPRALIQSQAALVVLGVLVFWRFWRQWSRAPNRHWYAVALLVVGIGLAGSLMVTGLHRYGTATEWYRVVGPQELDILAALEEASDPGDLVVASRGPNGNPIGWWVEGYSGRPTYTSINTGFLAFPDEREQALTAAEIFSAPPEAAAGALQELGARFLLLDRRGPDAGWAAGQTPPDWSIVQDGTLLILDLSSR